MAFNFNHEPVLLKEVIGGLNLKKGSRVIDATVGGAGHSSKILEKLGEKGHLICLDQDKDALKAAGVKLDKIDTKAKVSVWHMNFADIKDVCAGAKVDAILADIGVSSHQIDEPKRGFSYMNEGPLDMRMNQSAKLTASDVVNKYRKEDLARIIKEYGEEGFAKQIADNIVKARPIETTTQLAKICEESVFGKYWKLYGHPAKKTFQAIRIEVNKELEILEKFIHDCVNILKSKGRLAIITFHSLEDRIVKQTFRHLEKECTCPPKMPQCICGHQRTVTVITKKPIIPGQAEQERNPRSTSAKLRILEKI